MVGLMLQQLLVVLLLLLLLLLLLQGLPVESCFFVVAGGDRIPEEALEGSLEGSLIFFASSSLIGRCCRAAKRSAKGIVGAAAAAAAAAAAGAAAVSFSAAFSPFFDPTAFVADVWRERERPSPIDAAVFS